MKYINTIQTFNIAPKQYPGGINLSSHMQIYVNEYQYVTVDFPDIFHAIIKLFSGTGLVELCQMTCFIELQSRTAEA